MYQFFIIYTIVLKKGKILSRERMYKRCFEIKYMYAGNILLGRHSISLQRARIRYDDDQGCIHINVRQLYPKAQIQAGTQLLVYSAIVRPESSYVKWPKWV